jgi:hypothetical protein
MLSATIKRCIATTETGRKCKRRTTNKSGYCSEHLKIQIPRILQEIRPSTPNEKHVLWDDHTGTRVLCNRETCEIVRSDK